MKSRKIYSFTEREPPMKVIKKGRLLCIRTFNVNIQSKFHDFIEGEYYDYELTTDGTYLIHVEDGFYWSTLYIEYDFYSEKELRKLKLDKINNSTTLAKYVKELST